MIFAWKPSTCLDVGVIYGKHGTVRHLLNQCCYVILWPRQVLGRWCHVTSLLDTFSTFILFQYSIHGDHRNVSSVLVLLLLLRVYCVLTVCLWCQNCRPPAGKVTYKLYSTGVQYWAIQYRGTVQFLHRSSISIRENRTFCLEFLNKIKANQRVFVF